MSPYRREPCSTIWCRLLRSHVLKHDPMFHGLMDRPTWRSSPRQTHATYIWCLLWKRHGVEHGSLTASDMLLRKKYRAELPYPPSLTRSRTNTSRTIMASATPFSPTPQIPPLNSHIWRFFDGFTSSSNSWGVLIRFPCYCWLKSSYCPHLVNSSSSQKFEFIFGYLACRW